MSHWRNAAEHWREIVNHLALAGVTMQTPKAQSVIGGMLIAAAASLATTYVAIPVSLGRLETKVDLIYKRQDDVIASNVARDKIDAAMQKEITLNGNHLDAIAKAQDDHEAYDRIQYARSAVCDTRITQLETRISEGMYNLRRSQAK